MKETAQPDLDFRILERCVVNFNKIFKGVGFPKTYGDGEIAWGSGKKV